ncbi:MAG: TIGR02450 family Trp-rich protein [Gammaproteobacteria bacterium]
MNRINPNKLLLTKWTAVNPRRRERHFMVTRLIRSADDKVIRCELVAVINNHACEIDWQTLKDSATWTMGWK